MTLIILFVWFTCWVVCRVAKQPYVCEVVSIVGWLFVVLFWLFASGRVHAG